MATKNSNSRTNIDKVGKMMPNSISVEQTVLGCALIDDVAAFGIISKLDEKDFYSEVNQKIFEAMKNLQAKSVQIDFVTVTDELDRIGELENVGGTEFITSLSNLVPSAVKWENYADIVKNYSVNRALIYSCEKVIGKAYQAEEDSLKEAERAIFELAEKGQRSDLIPVSTSLKEVMDGIEAAIKEGGKRSGIMSGFHSIDAVTNGFHNSDLVLLAARPSVGKTALALNFILNASKKGTKCALFDLEMSKEQLVFRLLSSLTGVDMMKIMSGNLDAKDWKKIFAASKELNGLDIYLDDSSLNTPGSIISKCRKLKREHGLEMVVIDYLQLMYPESKSDSRQQDVSDISRQMKIMAKELNVPVILLSQLSRAVEHRTDKKPVLSDLRESGAIEQDADIVMFIHRPEELKGVEVEGAGEDYAVDIIFAKHRNGKVGSVKIGWKGSKASFVNLSGDANKQSLYETAPTDNSESSSLSKLEAPVVVDDANSDIFD